MRTIDLIVVFGIFQIGWFGCVLLAPTPYSFFSLAIPAILAIYLFFTKNINFKISKLAALIFVAGLVFDYVLISNQLIVVRGASVFNMPVWLISLWLLYSISMLKLGGRMMFPLWTQMLLGAVFGPLSYRAGEFFQVLFFASPMTFAIYAIFWAMLFPLTINLAKRCA